jgi:GNAT superfamily N-acetyltransferase
MRLKNFIAERFLTRARRHLGMNFVRVLQHGVGDAVKSAGRRHPRVACRVLSEGEALAFAADPALRLSRQWVRAAYARGAVGLGAMQDGRLVGYTWLAYSDTPYDSTVWCALKPGLRYTYKSFVRPEYRGQRIIQALYAFADRPELWRGRRASLYLVNSDNLASLASLERIGCRSLGHVTYARIFDSVIAFHSPELRRAGIHLYAGGRHR